jgi:hypothetical protein
MMLRPCRFTKRWRTRLLLIVLTGLAFALNITSIIQAQDGGQAVDTRLRFQINPQTSFNPFCLGQTRTVSVSLRLLSSIPEEQNYGVTRSLIPALGQTFDQTILEDVTTDRPFSFGYQILEQTFTYRALTVGDTSIAYVARVAGQQFEGSLPVHVIPCDYEVDVSIVWTATMNDAGVIIFDSIQDARLQFRPDYTPVINPNLRRVTMANRVRGCQGPSNNMLLAPEQMTGQLEENNEIHVTLDIYPQDASTLFTCNRPFVTGISCDPLPDGRCHPAIAQADFWTFEPINVQMSTDGGTATIPLTVTHAGGTGQGSATITITPVRTSTGADAGTR